MYCLDMSSAIQPLLFSVGHSNHKIDTFINLLNGNEIKVLVDVRTFPSSRYSPQFNQQVLKPNLSTLGIEYRFLGDSLGGRPSNNEFYDEEGFVLYDRIANSEIFNRGLSELLEISNNSKVAMMCSEGLPDHCHRHLLVSRVLLEKGIEVKHILPKGELTTSTELLQDQTPPPTLFGEEEMHWKSIQSVSQNIQQ
tara:strand:- start:807 stop:1391 length:585 start_codon:yes stop_codon:yes gene_type:complete